jgi:hypothetical protein
MKKQLIIWCLTVWTLGAAFAQDSGEFPVPLSDPAKRGRLKAHINYGSIIVKGTARKDVLVKYKAANDNDREHDHDNDREKNSSGQSREGLKRISSGTLDLEVSENANYVKVSSDSWNNKMNLEIEVPSGFDLSVSTYNDGDLFIYNIQGELELTNYNGEITAENISGSVVATTYNGEIKVTFDKVTEGTPMSYSTYNGDLDLTFPANLKASFKMKTQQGEILSGFDMNVTRSGPVQKKDTKSGTYKVTIDDWVKGDVNGGGAEITLKNYNGDIILRKK